MLLPNAIAAPTPGQTLLSEANQRRCSGLTPPTCSVNSFHDCRSYLTRLRDAAHEGVSPRKPEFCCSSTPFLHGGLAAHFNRRASASFEPSDFALPSSLGIWVFRHCRLACPDVRKAPLQLRIDRLAEPVSHWQPKQEGGDGEKKNRGADARPGHGHAHSDDRHHQ